MKQIVRMALLLAAWVAAVGVWEVSDRWWLGVATSFVLTGIAYRIGDLIDRRAASKEAEASSAPDYRLVRH